MKKQTLSENTTCQSESYPRHSERSEESTCNREILARDVGEATSRTYRDTRKGTVVPLPQNDDLMCHSKANTRHSEAQAEESKKRLKQEFKNIICHPGGFPLCRENVTKCHIFERWRRVNGSEPSPGSEQIEHTKTECLYAKLCEREGNPRQLVSGSYQKRTPANKNIGQILNTPDYSKPQR